MNRRIIPAGADARRLTMHTAFSLLNNDIRRELLGALVSGERDVATLASELELDVSVVSNGLNILLDAGLVSMRPEWRQHLYRLADIVTATLQKRGVATISITTDDGTLQFDLQISPEFRGNEKSA